MFLCMYVCMCVCMYMCTCMSVSIGVSILDPNPPLLLQVGAAGLWIGDLSEEEYSLAACFFPRVYISDIE